MASSTWSKSRRRAARRRAKASPRDRRGRFKKSRSRSRSRKGRLSPKGRASLRRHARSRSRTKSGQFKKTTRRSKSTRRRRSKSRSRSRSRKGRLSPKGRAALRRSARSRPRTKSGRFYKSRSRKSRRRRKSRSKSRKSRRRSKSRKSRKSRKSKSSRRRKSKSYRRAPRKARGGWPGEEQAIKDFIAAYKARPYKTEAARQAAITRDIRLSRKYLNRSKDYAKWAAAPWKHDLHGIDDEGSEDSLWAVLREKYDKSKGTKKAVIPPSKKISRRAERKLRDSLLDADEEEWSLDDLLTGDSFASTDVSLDTTSLPETKPSVLERFFGV